MLKIEITVPEDAVSTGLAPAYLSHAMAAIGFERPASYGPVGIRADTSARDDVKTAELDASTFAEVPAEKVASATTSALTPSTRERGKPAPGKARRTKEEIAEDEAADAAEASAPQIRSNPENRVGPEDDAATQEQDAADEIAEAGAKTSDVSALTHDDVRQTLGRYVKKFGMDAAQADGMKVIGLVCGSDVVKISDIPNAKIAGVIAGIEEALAKNPFGRKAV